MKKFQGSRVPRPSTKMMTATAWPLWRPNTISLNQVHGLSHEHEMYKTWDSPIHGSLLVLHTDASVWILKSRE